MFAILKVVYLKLAGIFQWDHILRLWFLVIQNSCTYCGIGVNVTVSTTYKPLQQQCLSSSFLKHQQSLEKKKVCKDLCSEVLVISRRRMTIYKSHFETPNCVGGRQVILSPLASSLARWVTINITAEHLAQHHLEKDCLFLCSFSVVSLCVCMCVYYMVSLLSYVSKRCPVLCCCLHCFGGSLHTWQKQQRSLEESRRLSNPHEKPGFGQPVQKQFMVLKGGVCAQSLLSLKDKSIACFLKQLSSKRTNIVNV